MLRQRSAFIVLTIALSAIAAASQAPQTTSPIWSTPDTFWFRVSVPGGPDAAGGRGGNEWWSVDAKHGVRERLFDHRRLAIELSAKAKQEYGPLTLPFAEPDAQFVVKYDGVQAALEQGLAIEFNIGDEHWRCELHGEWDWARTPPSDYYCEEKDEAQPVVPSSDRVPSPDGKWEAIVQSNNVGVRSAGGAVRMLSTDGTADNSYHLGSLLWSDDSRSLSGYRVSQDVWRAPHVAGNVKTSISRREWTVGR
jgi:hypothetical protein